ncbi:hypothetical protein [Spirosoma rigui]|uniref:hypothetical protein n=1 Tax=Spirosoma rigui TaxID=564064 RepID=UPI0012D2D828|nr:hypothetical protein [Spirosoma rigui]
MGRTRVSGFDRFNRDRHQLSNCVRSAGVSSRKNFLNSFLNNRWSNPTLSSIH